MPFQVWAVADDIFPPKTVPEGPSVSARAYDTFAPVFDLKGRRTTRPKLVVKNFLSKDTYKIDGTRVVFLTTNFSQLLRHNMSHVESPPSLELDEPIAVPIVSTTPPVVGGMRFLIFVCISNFLLLDLSRFTSGPLGQPHEVEGPAAGTAIRGGGGPSGATTNESTNSSGKARSWCFTVFKFNNEVIEDPLWTGREIPPTLQHCVYQVEKCPTTGKLHLQGLLTVKNPLTMTGVKKLLNDPSAHLEIRKGSFEEAAAYCKKSKTKVRGPWEYGQKPAPGTRTDILQMNKETVEGKLDLVAWAQDPARAHVVAHSYKWFEHLASKSVKRRDPKLQPKIFVALGCSGGGKSYDCLDYLEAQNVGPVYKYSINKEGFFNGYEGQRAVFYDEFLGSMFPLTELKQLLHQGAHVVKIKNGSWSYNAEYIAISSNEFPTKWYQAANLTPIWRVIDTLRIYYRPYDPQNPTAERFKEWHRAPTDLIGDQLKAEATAFWLANEELVTNQKAFITPPEPLSVPDTPLPPPHMQTATELGGTLFLKEATFGGGGGGSGSEKSPRPLMWDPAHPPEYVPPTPRIPAKRPALERTNELTPFQVEQLKKQQQQMRKHLVIKGPTAPHPSISTPPNPGVVLTTTVPPGTSETTPIVLDDD